MSRSDLTRTPTCSLVSSEHAVASLVRPGPGVRGEVLGVPAPAPSPATPPRPTYYAVVAVDSSNNTGELGNILRVTR